MSCEEMDREWEDIEEDILEILPQLVEPPPLAVIMEEIHMESHVLIDFEKMRLGKPNLKKSEMSGLLLKAGQIVKKRLCEKARVPARQLLHAFKINSS